VEPPDALVRGGSSTNAATVRKSPKGAVPLAGRILRLRSGQAWRSPLHKRAAKVGARIAELSFCKRFCAPPYLCRYTARHAPRMRRPRRTLHGIRQSIRNRSWQRNHRTAPPPGYKLELSARAYPRDAAVIRGQTVDIGESDMSIMLRDEVTTGEVVRQEFALPFGGVEVHAFASAMHFGTAFSSWNPAVRKTSSNGLAGICRRKNDGFGRPLICSSKFLSFRGGESDEEPVVPWSPSRREQTPFSE